MASSLMDPPTDSRWMEVSPGGQFLSSGWPHYPATRIWPTQTLLGSPELLPDQPRPLHMLSKEAATDMCPCGKRQTMSHIVNSCPSWRGQLNSNCTQLTTLLPNGWRHTASQCTWQQQQHLQMESMPRSLRQLSGIGNMETVMYGRLRIAPFRWQSRDLWGTA